MTLKKPRRRRGQAEIIGGLIVLTLIFMFAVPILLTSYYNAERTASTQRILQEEQLTRYNERLSVAPVDPNNELAIRASWIPGVWINNTGTVPVTLDKLYLIDTRNNTIYAIIDLAKARPDTSPLIAKMLLDVDPTGGTSKPLPPPGTPITLQPGENLLVVLNSTIVMPAAPFLIARVESTTGILHPVTGGGAPQTLLGQRALAAQAANATWRGIYLPRGGFRLIGYSELANNLIYKALLPAWRIDTEAYNVDVQRDPSNPLLNEVIADGKVYRGFLGTIDYNPVDHVYIIDGYFTGSDYLTANIEEITANNPRTEQIYEKIFPSGGADLDNNSIMELILRTASSLSDNIDVDNDGDPLDDTIAAAFTVARTISGVDYIRVDVKLVYKSYIKIEYSTEGNLGDLLNTFREVFGIGDVIQNTVTPRIASIILWRYDSQTGDWVVSHIRDFYLPITRFPTSLELNTLFPTNKSDIYRIGIALYDPYTVIKREGGFEIEFWGIPILGGQTTLTARYEFLFGIERVLVEYGVVNPFFHESPPIYIVAIRDPSLIGGIGEEEYASIYGTSLEDAKVGALSDMVKKLEEELNYAGMAGYTVISNVDEFCNILFGDNPPKYAIIYWMQGNPNLSEIVGNQCPGSSNYGTFNYMLKDYSITYHWVWVWPYGDFDTFRVYIYEGPNTVLINSSGPFNLSITPAGLEARRSAYAFYLYNNVNFSEAIQVLISNWGRVVVWNATFYTDNATYPQFFGTVALWLNNSRVFGNAIMILNPVHVDWDASGDGALPETIVQQIVYSSLRAWSILRYGGS